MKKPDWMKNGQRVQRIGVRGRAGTIQLSTTTEWVWVNWDSGDASWQCWEQWVEDIEPFKDMTTKDTNPKDALGCKKPPLSMVPANVLLEVGAAMLEGHAKGYRRHNYRVAGIRTSIYYDAAMRHLMAFWEGETIDPDSGVSHITKAIAGLIVLRDAQMNGLAKDDRPPRPASGWMADIQSKVDNVLTRYPEEVEPYTEQNKVSPMENAKPGFAGPTDKELHDDS